MANNCNYTARIVGTTRESVQQYLDAMRYRDLKNGYFFCRIFNAFCDDGIIQEDNDLYWCEVFGDCAWAVDGCMISNGYGTWRGMNYGEPHFSVWRDWEGQICYSNLGVTAPMLCKILGCSIEIWASESGCEFQEHYIVNKEGEIIVSDTEHWEEGYDKDENGDFIDYNPDKDVGGFDDFGEFTEPYELLHAE